MAYFQLQKLMSGLYGNNVHEHKAYFSAFLWHTWIRAVENRAFKLKTHFNKDNPLEDGCEMAGTLQGGISLGSTNHVTD